MIVRCPTCGAEVEFRYDDSFVRVCGHCRSAVLRTDRGVETLGRFADLVPIASPLRLFAEGHYGTAGFLLIGMAQLRHAAGGVWQEWYAKLDGGQWAWLSEAQGRLYVTFERPDVPAPPLDALMPGAQIQIAGGTFTVSEHATATYVSAQGEIPYRLVPNSGFQFVDLSDGRGGFATIDYGDGSEAPAVYLGYQVTPQSLALSGGEAAAPAPAAATAARLACPNCSGSLELRAPDQTLRVACPYCGSLVNVEGGTLSILARQAKAPKPGIQLGSTGKFAEGELTVIGYVARSAYVDETWWPFEEYLLYAPGVGFRWLVCSDGHWSYVQPVSGGAVSAGVNARYGGVWFNRYAVAVLRVDAVLGEFYWRVEAGERVNSEDYIAPPAMLSRESSPTEENWSLSTYMTVRQVEQAFGRSLGLLAPLGIGPNQPYPGGIGKVAALASTVFLALGIAKCASAPDTERQREHFAIPMNAKLPKLSSGALGTDDPMLAGIPKIDSNGRVTTIPVPKPKPIDPALLRPSRPVMAAAPTPIPVPLSPPAADAGSGSGTDAGSSAGSDAGSGAGTGSGAGSGSDASAEPSGTVLFSRSFHLDGGRNIEVDLYGKIDNNWVYAALDLVNTDTNGVVSFDKSIEYYSGYDDGESWNEGSRSADEVIGPVEPGTYVLRVEGQHGGLGTADLQIQIHQGVFRAVWFWIWFALLFSPFVAIGLHAALFRSRRWKNSNLGGSES